VCIVCLSVSATTSARATLRAGAPSRRRWRLSSSFAVAVFASRRDRDCAGGRLCNQLRDLTHQQHHGDSADAEERGAHERAHAKRLGSRQRGRLSDAAEPESVDSSERAIEPTTTLLRMKGSEPTQRGGEKVRIGDRRERQAVVVDIGGQRREAQQQREAEAVGADRVEERTPARIGVDEIAACIATQAACVRARSRAGRPAAWRRRRRALRATRQRQSRRTAFKEYCAPGKHSATATLCAATKPSSNVAPLHVGVHKRQQLLNASANRNRVRALIVI
jgi:hypothetical protein